jgi:hypothetical protein
MTMTMTLIDFLFRRRVATVAPALVAAACLLAAGCGGSGPASTTHKIRGGVKAIGPADLGANVTGLMKANQAQLKHIKAHCPSGPPTHFPVQCTFGATQVAPTPGSTKKGAAFPGPYRVAGTIKVLGVYFRTRTYEYQLDYAPTH